MKKYYMINEISKLYGIGPDSLRYYEKLGILKPRRGQNGYRLYGLNDIYKLNIISDLRSLDFSMAQIKDYLDGQCLSNTLSLLCEETELLDKKIAQLTLRRKLIAERIQDLKKASAIKDGVITEKSFPARFCVRLNQRITLDEEMDFVIKRLHSKYEHLIRDFGNQTIGATLSVDALKQGIANVYDSVFFILDEPSPDADFVLPSGTYLSCFYRGSYVQNAARACELLLYAQQNNLKPIGNPFELYEIDNRDTIQEAEFLTELQLQYEPLSR